MTDALPPLAMMVNYRVDDFEAWKAVFEAGEQNRAASGFLGHHVNRAQDDPNSLTLYFAIGDRDRATAYVSSDDVRALMQDATVSSEPVVSWAVPRAENIVWDRELPAVMISHMVADFDAWLEGYKSPEAEAMRAAGGVIGHAANQAVDEPNLAIVYHQAESFEALHALVGSDELRHVMKEAGVTSDPEFTYVTGMMGKLY
jgi:quinol monooxygenase YgiN